ncbi:hypothetical protein Tco_1153137 [Tanacetum coccineum]
MEQAVEQHRVESKTFEVKMNQVLNENERLLEQVINKDIVNIIMNSFVDNVSVNVHECEKCLKLETELLNKKDFVEKEIYDKLFKSFTTLEKHCISLEVDTQLNQEIFQRDNSVSNQSAPSFDQLFELNELKAQSQEKDTVIKKLKERIKSLSGKMNEDKIKKDLEEIETINIELDHRVSKLIAENEHLKQTYKQLYDSIKPARIRSKEQCDDLINQVNLKSVEISDLNASLQEKVLELSLNDELRKLKGKTLVDNAVTKHTIDPEMLNNDVEPITPKLLNNRTAHSAYIKHTQEEAAVLRDLVEHVKANYPLDHPLESACRKPTALDNETPKPVVTLVYSRKPRKSKTHVPVSKSKVVQIVLWYLDFGCSKHMTGDHSQLTNFVNNFLGTVKFKNDHVAKILGYGDYQIGNITISKVYYVEGLGHNLFSVWQFCDSNLEVAFRQHTCFINNLEGVDLLTGSRGNNLYTLSLGDMMASSPICLLSKASKTKFWLGTNDHLCFAYAMGKSKKKPRKPKSEDTNQEKLYLLHMDLCGPHMDLYGPMRVLHEQALFCYYKHSLTAFEPKNEKDALTQACWIEAMQEELNEFECLEVWELVPRLDKVMVITLKWIYKVKLDELGESFAPVARFVAIRIFPLALCCTYEHGRPTQMNLKDRDSELVRVESHIVQKNAETTKELLLVQIYVDDIIFAASTPELCDLFSKIMCSKFKMSMMGKISFISFRKPPPTNFSNVIEARIFINQSKYALESIKEITVLTLVTPVDTPMVEKSKLDEDKERKAVDDPSHYRDADKAGLSNTRRIHTEQSEFARLVIYEFAVHSVKRIRRIMSITKEQQQALDDALVPREQRLMIGSCNYRLSTTFKSKEPTFQVDLDVLSLTPFYPDFLITASVSAMCPKLPGQKFVDSLFEEEILTFMRELGYSGNIKLLSDVKVEILLQPWRTFGTIINKCLSGKVTGIDTLRVSRAQILWGLYHQKKVDYVYLLWEDLVFQIENKESRKTKDMFYPRFTKVIINHFMSQDQSIPRRNKVDCHMANDDPILTTMRFIPQHEVV